MDNNFDNPRSECAFFKLACDTRQPAAPPQDKVATIKKMLAEELLECGKGYSYERQRYPEAFSHLMTAVEAFDEYERLKNAQVDR